MRVTYCLREPKAKKETPIVAFVHWTTAQGHHQWKIATGLRVHPREWNQERRRVKRGVIGEAQANARLAEIETNVRKLFAELGAIGHDLAPATVRQRFAMATGAAPAEKAPEFFAAYERFFTENTGFTKGTQANHRKAMNHLRAFTKTQGLTLTFDRFDILFWDRFLRHLLTGRQMTNESAWNVAKSIKAFLADAFEKGNHRNQTFRKVTRKQLVTQADINDLVYLTPEELTAVRDLDLSKDERLARVRDLFVFLCFTGLRFSDSQQVCPEHRRGNTLRFTTGKNRKTVTVPLSPVAVAILDAYEGTLPQISNQKANEYLTEVLEEADIIEPVQIVRYRGTERVERTKRKCDVVGMHGAKRTFVTLGLLRGASAEALAKVTGNTVKTLRTYDVRTAEDAAEEVRQVWSE